MAPADQAAMEAAVRANPGWATYSQVVDRESASERLAARMQAGAEEAAHETASTPGGKTTAKPRPATSQESTFEKIVKSSTFKYAARYAAREAVRGMFGIGRR